MGFGKIRGRASNASVQRGNISDRQSRRGFHTLFKNKSTMDSDDDWSLLLDNHPIFSPPKLFTGPGAHPETSLELSTSTLPNFTNVDPNEDGPTPSGRRQVMVLKDAELILAAGKEIRITSLGDTKLSRTTRKTYKVRLPNSVHGQR